MSILDSATTMLRKEATIVADSISDFTSSITGIFKTVPTVTLPLANVLHDYATYDYIIGISVLTAEDVNDPDNSYMKNITLPTYETPRLICKTAGCEPNNRVKTDYGKHEFFIDDLSIESVIGLQEVNVTNATNFSFTVTEPYSMGLFPMACQQAALEAGHNAWIDAPFLLTLEFRGNTEIGSLLPIPDCNRYFPLKFSEIDMQVNHTGSTYTVQAFAWNDLGRSQKNSKLKTDMTIKGSSVQEALQTGEQSLQAVWNKQLKSMKDKKAVAVPDEIIILFPKDIASDKGSDSGQGATMGSAASSESIYKKLGVTKSSINDTQVQSEKEVNIIGKSSMGYGHDKRPDAPFGKENEVYNEENKVNVRDKNNPKPTEGTLRFRQDTSITNAINQVLLSSQFAPETLDEKAISPEGYRKWWRIDMNVYLVDSNENLSKTGTRPKVIVYRVIPYNTHAASGIVGANQKPVGYDKLLANVCKEYNYIYTGRNTDVLEFEINIKNGFTAMMTADITADSQDTKTNDPEGKKDDGGVHGTVVPGKDPQKGASPTRLEYLATLTLTDNQGGGGTDTIATRVARLYHDALTRGNDMFNLDMKIVGDPFFLAQSGTGNYTSQQTQYPNLNVDGTVHWQGCEVIVAVNFRTPIDIQQDTGLYAFNGDMPTSPLMQYSGIFKISDLVSNFKGGKFEQNIRGWRHPLQEMELLPERETLFSLDNILQKGLGSITNLVS